MGEDPWRVPATRETKERDAESRKPAPWDSPQRHAQPSRLARLIVFLLGIVLLMTGLSLAFPISGAVDPYLVRGLLVLVIFGGAAAYWSRSSLLRLAKVAGLWALIIAGLSTFYLYRSDLGTRFMSAVDPSGVINTEEGLLIHRSRDGHFWLRARLNGVPVRFMIDTGASNVVLSPDDAMRIGINMRTLDYSGLASTANGQVRFAKATIPEMAIGQARFYDVPVTVNGADMQGSLLGMTVLKEFSSIEFRGDTLILRP